MYLYIFNSEGNRCQHIFCTACLLASKSYLLVHYTLNAPVLNLEDFVSLSCVEKVFCRNMGMLSVEWMLVLCMLCLVDRQFWFLIFICQYSWNQKLRFFDWTVTVIFWYVCVFCCIMGIVSYSSHFIYMFFIYM